MSREGKLAVTEDVQQLHAENIALKKKIEELKRLLSVETAFRDDDAAIISQLDQTNQAANQNESSSSTSNQTFEWHSSGHSLTREEIQRYSRQLILPALGVQGQARLRQASVLVVGAGGLGSPAILYLAAAGIGRLGIADRDAVELSNIHRQVIHTEASVGRHKAESASAAVAALNSNVQVEVHREGLQPGNVLELVQRHDIVVDASDNAPTRYLISDACVVAGKPLVSGAAIGTDGQLTVYNHGDDGPCYRCLFPVPPRPDSCSRCSDAGVLGPVPGVIGCLQALEAIKLAAGVGKPLSRRLLIMDALSGRFNTVQLRPRSATCQACGDAPSITADTLASTDYAAFTGQAADDAAPCLRLLPSEARISAATAAQLLHYPQAAATAAGSAAGSNAEFPAAATEGRQKGCCRPADGAVAAAAPVFSGGGMPWVLDVRPADQFDMCHLPGSVNIPFEELHDRLQEVEQLVAGRRWHADAAAQSGTAGSALGGTSQAAHQPADGILTGRQAADVLVVCRRGNDSQVVVGWLQERGIKSADVIDGLNACGHLPGSAFPKY